MLLGVKARTFAPPTIILWSDGRFDDVGAGTDVVADETVGGEEEPEAAALARNVAKSAPGLTAKTIPDLQCVPWRQNAQMGVFSVTVRLAIGKSPV